MTICLVFPFAFCLLPSSEVCGMAKSPEPVVLDLASLPREQMGPFLILGLEKSADKTIIERHWADRIKWARRQLIKVPLEDINWAREELSEPLRRIKADAGSLNADTSGGILASLSQHFGVEGGQAARMWQPLDSEKNLADYSPPAEVPERNVVRAAITLPAVPEDVPAGSSLLHALAEVPLDPWAIALPGDGDQPPAVVVQGSKA
jgi:hypothetical protein